MRPYNASIYDIRNNYRTIFPEEEFAELDDSKIESDKIYKIKYSLNCLTMIGQHIDSGELKNTDISFFEICTSSDELSMFQS